MNKHLYRIIFNRVLGLFQVVSELVRRPGRGAACSGGAVAAAVRPLSLAVWVACGWVGLTTAAHAQITPDMRAPGGQRPTVMGAPGNVPLINIQTPSAVGVSRNTYGQFNVGAPGAVLNNSRTNVQTQLAGAVAGNPWLAAGTARIILNEVSGSNPSQLSGYIEVAGDRAQVIIANPAGISCDGCGVINASRFTLTTGAPVLHGGVLDGYRVGGGAVRVDGKGMDASRANYADIMARAVQINAGVWAPALKVTTGTTQLSADHASIEAIRASSEKPAFALDVSALGGMYANKISLLGTEHGVGVRNAGNIGAQAGELIVTVDGRLENSGKLQSRTDTVIRAQGGISNSGTLSATRELRITTPQDVDNRSGQLNAARIAVDAASLRNAGGSIVQTGAQGVKLEAGTISNRNGGNIGMPVASAGGGTLPSTPGTTPPATPQPSTEPATPSITAPTSPVIPLADGVLHVAGLLDNDGGRIGAVSGFDLSTSAGLNNDGGQLGLRQLKLGGGDLSNRGGILAIEGVSSIHANQVNNDTGRLTFAKAFSFDAQSLSNRAGTFLLIDAAPMVVNVAGVLDNSNGSLASNAASLTLDSGSLLNEHGKITHAGSEGLTLRAGNWSGAGGTVATAGSATITAGQVDHRDATLGATQLTLHADQFDNRGGSIVASGSAASTLQVNGSFDNGDQGTVAGNGDLGIQARVFGNARGSVQQAGNGALNIQATTLNGAAGTLASNGTLSLAGDALDLSRASTVAQTISIDTGTLDTTGGSVQALSDHALSIHAAGAWDNSGGSVATNGALELSANTLSNHQGTLSAAGVGATQINVTDALDNTGGRLAARGATTVQAGALINQGGSVQAVNGSALTIDTRGLLDNSAHGTLATDGDFTLSAATLDNTQGNIQHAGSGKLRINAATLEGSGGSIASNGTLSLSGDRTNLRGASTHAQDISIDTGSLITAEGMLQASSGDPLAVHVRNAWDNSKGSVISNGVFALQAGSLLNQAGTLIAAGAAASDVRIVGAFNNANGRFASAGAITLHAGSLDNSSGTLQSASDSLLRLSVDGTLDNDQGTLQGNGAMNLVAASVSNRGGAIQAATSMSARISGALDNTGGTLIAGGDLSLRAGSVSNRDTLATDASNSTTGIHAQQLNLDTGALDNGKGRIQASKVLSITSAELSNSAGVLDGSGDVSIKANSLDNRGGKLIQHGDSNTLALEIKQALNNTASGTLGAEGSANLHAGSIDNSGGTAFARQDLNITSDAALANRNGGLVQANGALALSAAGVLDNAGGSVEAAGMANVKAGSINNAGGHLLAGSVDHADASLQIRSAGAIDNQNGSIGNRGGDLSVQAASIDNRSAGHLVAGRDLDLDQVGALDNGGGTVHAARDLSFRNAGATLDNSQGQLGTGNAARLMLASIINNGGHVQADTLWLTTPLLSNAGGDIGANNAHVTLTTLGGLGVIHGSRRLDVHFLGDYTHLVGQQLQSDGVLALTVDGALVNQGALQTRGKLDLTAASLVNQNGAVINASAADGSGIATITTTGDIDNRAGASIAGDTLTLSAGNVTNTSSQGISGDTIRINAQSLTNGRDLGTADAAMPFGEGFIGASQSLDLHLAQRLANLDGDIYSGGSSNITGLADGARLAVLDNISGRIQAEGDADVAADIVNNKRRFVETETYDLSESEKHALSSERANDNALTAAEQAREDALFKKYEANNGLSIDDTRELVSYLMRTGWVRDEHVSDADLQILNAAYKKIAIGKYGQRDGYLAVSPDGNPGALLKQTDTYLTGTRVKRESAASQILAGGHLHIDLGQHLVNYASHIAATGDLSIGGKAYDGSADARIDNIAITGQYTFRRDMDFMVQPPVPVKYLSDQGWQDDMAAFAAHRSTDVLTSSGNVLLDSTITGRNVSISGRDINNTAVAAGGGLTTLKVDDLAGQGATHLSTTDSVAAANVASVQGAQANAVTTGTGPQQAGAQKVGNADQAIPGLVAPSNGMYNKHADANAPFLVTTAPRFAKGASTSSDYLLRALGDDPGSIHKRLGDGYYEQNLVLDQLLQLTGRRTLNGGDGLAQYQSLMDGAAKQAAQLGLQLGAPLTSTQIAALSSDIVWLVDQVVDGQHVLVPVVYLTQATAQRLRVDGALIAGNTVDIQASGTVRNDGRISGTQSASIGADTLINRGAIDGGERLAITTRQDTINHGSLSGNRIGIVAGGDVVNAPAIDGLAARGGVINAGAAGVQIVAGNDVINQGRITSQGDAVIAAGRDVVQNAASSAFGTPLPAGSITAAGNAALVAGRDVTLDQSKLDAGQVATINAGRDVQLTAATVHGGTGVGISAGRDIVSDTTTEHTAAEQAVKGKHGSVTTSAETITHGSTISSGGDLSLQAGRDISLTAANVKADGAVGVVAGRDIDLQAGQNTHTESTTAYVKGGHTQTQTNDTSAVGTTVSGNKGVAIGAGRDLTATAASIGSDNGNVALLAGRDLTLNTANDMHSVTIDTTSKRGNALTGKTSTSTHDSVTDAATVGTSINGKNVSLAAGHDLTAQAAQVKADQAIRLSAGNDVNLTAGQNVRTEEHDYSKTTSHLLNTGIRDFGAIEPDRRETRIAQGSEQTSSAGTLLSGDSVSIAAGHDLNATAAQVAGTHDVVLAAGHDLNLQASENTYTETDTTNKSRSGRMNGGGLSVMVGKQSSKDATTVRDISHTGSMVGSTDGSVTLSAGNNVHITGSDVLSQTGTAIVGKNVTIDAAIDSTDTRQTHHQGQGGVHLGLGGMAADLANSVIADGQRGSQVSDPRLKALYAAKTAYDVKALKDLKNVNPGAFQAANKDTNPNGINLQLGIGGSSASSQMSTHDETAHGSNIRSQGNVTIAATGGDLDIIGSQVSGDNVALAAANHINLRSQAEDHSLKSGNKNASGEVGVQIGSDGFGFYGQASVGAGKAHGNGTTHAETSIDAKNTLTLASGGDTTLQGAQAKGNTVLADIGNNLHIRSEQDSDDYASKQQQASGKVVIGYGSGASGSYNQSRLDSHSLSVNEVSGIGAGDGGFNIHVNGHTDLQGGVIASTADPSKNLLDTGSLSFSNLQNQSRYSATQFGISGGSSMGSNVSGAAGAALSLATPQHDKENSTTQAGIADGTLTVRDGNTDLTGLDRHPTLDNQALKPIFDEQNLQLHQELGQVAGQVGMHTAGVIANYMVVHATTDEEVKSWQDGGSNKILLHGLVGAITADLGGSSAAQGALGAAASEAVSEKMKEYLNDHGANPNLPKGKLLMELASAAIGTVGGGAGASTAIQGEQFNRQLDENEKSTIRFLAKGDPQREADLIAAGCALAHCSAQYAIGTPEYLQYSKLEALGNQPQYAADRELLSQQTYTRTVVAAGMAIPVTENLFGYSGAEKAGDAVMRFDDGHGHPLARTGGALQAVGGVGAAAGGATSTITGAAACPETLGAGCGLMAGGALLTGWGLDQTQAGARTVWTGISTPTLGATGIQQLFGISPQASELLYNSVGFVGGMSLGGLAKDMPEVTVRPPVWRDVDAEAGGWSQYSIDVPGRLGMTHEMLSNPGPLAEMTNNPAANFAGGQYTVITLTKDTTLYRAGDSARSEFGQWYTAQPPASIAQVRIDSAVRPQWIDPAGILTGSSPINTIYVMNVPEGTIIYRGPVGYQGEIYLGGQSPWQQQIFIPKSTPGLAPAGQLPIK